MRFRQTVKSKNGGYSVKYLNKEKTMCIVRDGDIPLFKAKVRTLDDFVDECVNESNECAILFQMFITKKGNKGYYWYDTETQEDYITVEKTR